MAPQMSGTCKPMVASMLKGIIVRFFGYFTVLEVILACNVFDRQKNEPWNNVQEKSEGTAYGMGPVPFIS